MLNIWDTGHVWVPEMQSVAIARGYPARRIGHESLLKPGPIFFVPRQFPGSACEADKKQHIDLLCSHPELTWIQDPSQIILYEDKVEQYEQFGEWMPETFVAYDAEEAEEWLAHEAQFPLVSKSAYGSASHNVRLLKNADDARSEIVRAFGPGIRTRRGPGEDVRQKGYVFWQRFIAHEFTYRVTLVGTKYHVYRRFNYDDRPMACPSSVKQTEPCPMWAEIESLLDFSARFFRAIETQWCAIDVLKGAHGWRVLETSLAWARGNDPSGNACFYGTNRSLNQQHDLLLDELEKGVWAC